MKSFITIINYKKKDVKYKDINIFKTFKEAIKYAKESEDLPYYIDSEIIFDNALLIKNETNQNILK